MNDTNESWICPACGLLCDDLLDAMPSAIAGNQAAIHPRCAKASFWIEQQRRQSSMGENQRVVADWIATATTRLRHAKRPLIYLGEVDVESARAALRLAEQIQAHVLLDQSAAELAVQDALARQGTFSGSLGEVRAHADLVILCGSIASQLPRLRELFVDVDVDGVSRTREVLSIGSSDDPIEELSTERMHELLAMIRRLRRGDDPVAETSKAWEFARKCLSALRAHRSSAWIWTADGIGRTADLFARQLAALVLELNEERRATSVRCSLRPGLLTAEQVCVWLYGTTPPMEFTNRRPRPIESVRLDDFDFGLAVTELGPLQHLPDERRWMVFQGQSGDRRWAHADVMEVAVPGWDRNGQLFRGDSVLVRRLTGPKDRNIISAGQLLARLAQGLEGKVDVVMP